MSSQYVDLPVASGGGSGITSNNGDTTAAQSIVAGTGISVATVSGTTTITNTSIGTGTVTSVGVNTDSTTSSIFANTTNSITGSPITTSGNMTLTLSNQTTNKVLAAPSGSTGAPTFRALVSADIPSLSYVNTVGAFSRSRTKAFLATCCI